jgi:hypothetical protein
MLASTVIANARLDLADVIGIAADLTWSDAELLEHLNEGEREVCRRIGAIRVSTGTGTSLAVTSASASYVLDTKIIDVLRVKVPGELYPMTRTTIDILDHTKPSWEVATGTPRSFFTDDSLVIWFYPAPDADKTLTLTISRLPLADMTTSDPPEIAEKYHDGLKWWVLYRAMQKDDAKVDQSNKAGGKKEAFFLNEFEKVFGTPLQRPAPGSITSLLAGV